MSTQSLSDVDRPYLNAWNHIAGVGARKLALLAARFPSFADAWRADAKELVTAGLPATLSARVVATRPTVDVDALWQACADASITLLAATDATFPAALRAISAPPYAIYARGNVAAIGRGGVTIVGSRKASDYGRRVARLFAEDIAAAGMPVISGLALGIDALAHTAALDSGGTTIAVVGGGCDDATITPRSHHALAARIVSGGGAIISEYPPGAQPTRGTFPARNRLMAALADAVVIVEAASNSGTLVTARWARALNKKLFAVVGSVFSVSSAGSNTLVRDGHAMAALTPQDVIAALAPQAAKRSSATPRDTASPADALHQKLRAIIADAPDGIAVNALLARAGCDASMVNAALMLMELDGVVSDIGNHVYVARK